MSRGRRAVRLKPFALDGYKFISEAEARRYESLKSYAGVTLRADVSADGRMLVCQWGDGVGTRKLIQTFNLAQKKRQKFGSRVVVNGIEFGSKPEARRFADLENQQRAGIIRDLKPHPRTYECVVNNVLVASYTPDSEYFIVATGEQVIEDVKSDITSKIRDWPIRRKLMLACHGITVRTFKFERRRGA